MSCAPFAPQIHDEGFIPSNSGSSCSFPLCLGLEDIHAWTSAGPSSSAGMGIQQKSTFPEQSF